VCDRGFAIGLNTHLDPEMGSLVWMAEGFWEEEPTLDDVRRVSDWRWCVFFPLSVALHRALVYPIGKIEVPAKLRPFPLMRTGSKDQGWYLVRDGKMDGFAFETTEDRSLPPRILVNLTRLREMLVTDWRPESRW